jgi:cell division protein FtsB
MNTMFYVVCIVAVVFAADSYNKYLKMKQQTKQNDPELDESLKKIEMLEERIRVLERIVTESKHDLGREIDRL